MALIMSELFMHNLNALRVEPTAKRIRVVLDAHIVADTDAALLVWEPKRVVPTYAVPVHDVDADIRVTEAIATDEHFDRIPVWDPRVPFSVRQTPGHPVRIGVRGSTASTNGFIADDPDLRGYVILDFDAFDTWLEENDEIISHPHSPFSRIDIRASSKRIRFALDAALLAETDRALILFETGLPIRYYVPREDVLVDLAPSNTVTACAYKGVATYFSPVVDGTTIPDLAWSYENPLIDAERIRNYICFYDEKLDVAIDGVDRARPETPWS